MREYAKAKSNYLESKSSSNELTHRVYCDMRTLRDFQASFRFVSCVKKVDCDLKLKEVLEKIFKGLSTKTKFFTFRIYKNFNFLHNILKFLNVSSPDFRILYSRLPAHKTHILSTLCTSSSCLLLYKFIHFLNYVQQ